MSVTNPNAPEFERRELERMEEINVLTAEREDLGDALRARHHVWVNEEPGLFDGSAQWRNTTPAERTEIANRALTRILKISRARALPD